VVRHASSRIFPFRFFLIPPRWLDDVAILVFRPDKAALDNILGFPVPKIHDLLIEGVELALKKRGYPTLADMKAKWQRKER
jgi:hypothetical protein